MGQIALRLAALSARERRFLIAGAATLAAFLLYFLLAGGGEPPAIADEAPAAPVPTFHPPAPPPSPMSAPPPPAAAPASSLSGIVLHGVLGGGAAILGFPDGSQRAVPIGRQFLPGVRLKEVALSHVILSTPSGDSRLEFNKAASLATTSSPSRTAARTPEAERSARETLEFRTGLMPLKEGGRIRGFAVRPGADLAVFQRAGLKPGDVIVSVNGQAFRSEEKVLELSSELASARTIEIDFIRSGRKMSAKVQQKKIDH